MPAPDGPAWPVANCVLCGWPMDGTVNILEVHIGTVAVYRACAGECPAADVNRRSAVDRRRYIDSRHTPAPRLHRQIAKIPRLGLPDTGRLGDLERRYSALFGLDAPQRSDVNPSSAAGFSAVEVVKRVRDQTR
jgi:hypothetical protein